MPEFSSSDPRLSGTTATICLGEALNILPGVEPNSTWLSPPLVAVNSLHCILISPPAIPADGSVLIIRGRATLIRATPQTSSQADNHTTTTRKLHARDESHCQSFKWNTDA